MDRDLVEMKRAHPVPPTTYLNKAKTSISTGDLTLGTGTGTGAHIQPVQSLLRTLSVKEGVLSSLTYNNTLYNSNICHDDDNIIVDRKSFQHYSASTSGRGQNYDPNPIYLTNNYNDDEEEGDNNNNNMYDETKSVSDSDEAKSDTALLHTRTSAYNTQHNDTKNSASPSEYSLSVPTLTNTYNIPHNDITATTPPSEYSLSLPNLTGDLSPRIIRVSSRPDSDIPALPISTPVSTPLIPASTPLAPVAPGPDVRRLKLLVVDDSTMNRKMLCRLLTSQGYEYDEAGKIYAR